jgi:DNA-binding beta-propeller fold protein YncE
MLDGRSFSMKRIIKAALLAIILGFLGCASTPKKKEPVIFFPPAPELPRLQYLTSFSGLKDVEKQSSFNKFVVGEKQNLKLDKPYGVGIYDGKIYVCDTNQTVIVLDLRKKTYGPLAESLKGAGKLLQPVNISIDQDGTKYVADPVRGQVVVYDKDDAYVKAYGIPGQWRPVDAIPFEDRLYVADISTGLIKVFDKSSGEMVKTIGDKGEPSQRLDRPTNLAFDSQGYLYVTDIGRFQVVKFDRDGHFKSTIGKAGDNWGHFARPKGIAIDKSGLVYVVDSAFNNVQVFNNSGRLLLFFGEGGTDPGQFTLPAQVVIDYNNIQYFQKYIQPDFKVDYLVFVTSQLGDRSISVLAYGREKGKRYPSDQELQKQIEEEKKKNQGQKQDSTK